MDRVRTGVIGTGGMGRGHCKWLAEMDDVELTAVCDVNPEAAKAAAEPTGATVFTELDAFLDSGRLDAIVIATPHWQHPEIAIGAFARGIHVMCEKPIAVTVADADRMLAAHAASDRLFGVMFQWRSEPVFRRARELVADGDLGEIYRTAMICSHFRSQAYYDSGSWRATWEGEGGGVLLNQAPHNLDIFGWIAGMPEAVIGRCDTAMHRIEVEDVASALLRYPNGAHGYLHTSTVECPGTDLMEICGDRGKIVIQGRELRFASIEDGIRRFSDTTDKGFEAPPSTWRDVDCPDRPRGHQEIHRNFIAAILHGEELYAPGAESLASVELANAIILSSAREDEVSIPVPRDEYDRFMAERIAEAKGAHP